MKYIKTYEIIMGHFTDELKEFVLIENKYGIFIYQVDKKCYSTKLLFFSNLIDNNFNINKDDLLKTKGYFYNISKVLNFNDNILYQSDNLEEVIEYVQQIKNMEKYNL